MLKEFKDFLMRGNVMDLAVAVIIGGAFSAIVNSLVNDLVMPIVGILIGGIDFSALSVQVGSASLAYGKFIQAIVNFVLIGLTIFLVIKAIKTAESKLGKKKEEAEAAPPAPSEEVLLLRDILDTLRSNH
jgi:large conductance mechanosensitive channel